MRLPGKNLHVCRTTKERKARGKGISVYKVDGDNWELVQILEGQVNPSYLCLNKAQDRLYSIHGDFSSGFSLFCGTAANICKFFHFHLPLLYYVFLKFIQGI